MKYLLASFLLSVLVLGLGCGEGRNFETSAVYVTIDDFTHKYPPGATATLPLRLSAQGEKGWQGELKLMVMQDDSVLNTVAQNAAVEEQGEKNLEFSLQLPEAEGTYHLVAELTGHKGQTVRSRRLIEVEEPVEGKIN
jgi:hypothetical protein